MSCLRIVARCLSYVSCLGYLGSASCETSPTASSQECAAPLSGVWQSEGSQQRWALLERRNTVEAYPLFDDTVGDPTRVVSPRRVTAVRGKTALVGRVERWVMRDVQTCSLRAPVRIECHGGTLRFELPEMAPPTDLVTCQSPPSAPTPQRWRRAARW